MFDKHGPDAALSVKAFSYGLMVFGITTGAVFLLLAQGGMSTGWLAIVLTLVISAMLGTIVGFAGHKFATTSGAAAKAFIWPSGDTTPYERQFSYQESLAIRGQMEEALKSYEAIITEHPGYVAPRMRAAEHYAKGSRDLKRATELFREIRAIADVSPRDKLYATSRLVDLYQGPLNDPGRALVELRRIIEEHPTSPAAKFARQALPALKERLGAAGTQA
jgi:hypothetical protein